MKKTILAFSRVSPSLLEPYKDDYDVIIISPELGDMDAQFEAAISNAHGLIGGSRRLGQAYRLATTTMTSTTSTAEGSC